MSDDQVAYDKEEILENVRASNFDYVVHKDWYVEWVKIPKYIATGSVGAIVFLFSSILGKNNNFLAANHELVITCIVLFISSTIISFLSMLASYYYFDLNLRLYLEKNDQNRGFDAPNEKSFAFRALAASNLFFAVIAALTMLTGIVFLAKLLIIFTSP